MTHTPGPPDGNRRPSRCHRWRRPCHAPTAADRAPAPLPLAHAATLTPRRAGVHRAAYQDDRVATLLVAPADADAAHCCLHGSAPVPSLVAVTRPVLETAPSFPHSRTLAPQTATLPACAAGVRREHLLVFAAPPAHLRWQRCPIPGVRPPTHPRGHWPSWWPDLAVRLVSTPLPPRLYRFDTTPSSSSSFRTSLLVYHFLPLSPNICTLRSLIDRV